MDDLHSDIKAMQTRIVQWLAVYEKINVQRVQEEYNAKLQGLLEAIAEFDCNKIKHSQTFFANQVTHKYISSIELKIHDVVREKERQQQPTPSHPKSQIQQPIKQESSVSPNDKKQKKEGSFFASIFGKMGSKDKKSYQIILPDKQPSCYYDHNTRSYIFEGDQPQAPRIIPKPPSMKEIHKKEQTKAEKDSSELNAMIAPLAFKRKSTNQSKSKAKIKQEIQIAKIQDEPLTYSLLVQKINAEYDSMLHKIGLGVYAKLDQDKGQWGANEQIKQMVDFADRTLQYSHEISMAQRRLIERCQQILTRQNIELKLMQKVVRQCHQSHIIYDQLNQKASQQKYTSNLRDTQLLNRVRDLEEQLLKMQSEREIIEKQIEEQSKGYEQKERHYKLKQSLVKELEDKTHDLQEIIENLVVSRQQDEANISQLKNENTQLRNKVTNLHQQFDIITQRQFTFNQLIQEKQRDCLLSSQANQSLKQQVAQLQKDNRSAQNELESSKQAFNDLNLKLVKQRSEIIHLLNTFQQKQSTYLKVMMNLNETPNQPIQLQAPEKQLPQTTSSDKSLLDILKTSTQSHLSKMQMLYQDIVQLHRNHKQTNHLQSKLKQSYAQEITVMLQSQARLKSLVESYRTAKEETDQKCSKLEFECDKLRKKLNHYKEEEEFNRSYIFKLKTSNLGSNNDSMISLQSDNEELAQKLDSMEKQIHIKNENLTKLQTDLEDLLTDYQKDQFRQLELQKRVKQSDRNLRVQKQEKQELINKIRLLDLKLKNQKQKNQQLANKFQIKLANAEATHDKRSKILKQQLEQTATSNLQLKDQLNELTLSFQHRLQQKEDYRLSKEQELNLLLCNKSTEIHQLQEKTVHLHQQIQYLKRHRQTECMRFEQLSFSMNRLIDQHLKQISILRDNEANMNGIIAALLQKYNSYKQEQEEFKRSYEEKIITLEEELLQSKIQSEKLLQQLSHYCQLVTNFDQQIVRLQESQQLCRDKYEAKIRDQEQQTHQLQGSIEILEQQIEIKKQENLSMKNQIQQLQETLLLIQTQIDRQTHENSSIKSEMNFSISNLKKQHEEHTQTLTVQIHQLSEQLIKRQHELNNKQQQIVCLSAEIDHSRQELSQKTQLICSYQEEAQKLSTDLKQKQIGIKELEQNLQISNSAYKEMVQQNISLEQQLSRLKAVSQAKDASIVKLENDLITAANALQQKIHQLSIIQQNHLHALNAGVTSLKENISMKQQLIHTLSEELNQQKNKSTNYFNTLLEKQQYSLNLTIQMQMREKEAAALNEQVQSKVQMLEKVIQKQQNELSELNQQLQSNDIALESCKQVNQTLSTKVDQIVKQLNNKDDFIEQMKRQIQEFKANQLQSREKMQQIEKQKMGFEQRINNQQIEQKEQQTDFIQYRQLLQQLQRLQALILEKQMGLNDKNIKIQQLQLQNRLKGQSIQNLQNKIQQASSNNVNATQEIKSSLQDQQIQNLSKIGKLRKALAQKQRQLRQKTHKAADLQEKLDHTTKIVENQRQELQFLKNKQQRQDEQLISEDNQTGSTHEAQAKSHHRQLEQLALQFSLKEQSYKNKIERLQRELLNLISLKNINKTLEDNYKSLELQNASLNSQKVELLRSNSYLMEINQKLVAAKSHTHRDPPKSAIHVPSKETERQPKQQAKSQITAQQKHDQKSFFGSLSSFFLTPTERDRLTKG